MISCSIPKTAALSIFGSIKGRIFILFAVTSLSIVALTAFNFWNLSTVKTRLLLGERYDDLLNNILEARRFEKNFLFYNDVQSLAESRAYLDRIDGLVGELADDLMIVAGPETLARFRDTLHTYEQQTDIFAQNGDADREELRSLGKSLIDYADHFLKIKRARIHRVIVRTSILPFAFLAILLLLMVLVIKLISHGLLKPLDVVMSTTQRVARGDFSAIYFESKPLHEIACLVGAFNRMANELENNQEDLLQARKIAAIGTFTAGIAHELNNPINNIALTAESFREDYGERIDDSGQEMLKDILSQADRAADIVKNLLDFSRTESPVFSQLEPAEVLNSTLNLVKNQIKLAGLRLELSMPAGLPRVRGNLRNLQQVFMNLLLNAVQATPPGGLVAISAESRPPEWVRFQVRDTGPGIPEGIRQQIFEPFFSTKEVGKGTGLGLAVTYSLIKRHGGRIDVSNAADQGAVFSVWLPVAGPEEPAEVIGGGKS
ncbi:MAG: sensor histidine kinase [Hyphomicrobiales bacterium]